MEQPLTIGGIHLENIIRHLPHTLSEILETIWVAPATENPARSYQKARAAIEEYIFQQGITPIPSPGRYYIPFEKLVTIVGVYSHEKIHAYALYRFCEAIVPILSGCIYWRDSSGWDEYIKRMCDSLESFKDLHVALSRINDDDFSEKELKENIFDKPTLEQALRKPLGTTKKTMGWVSSLYDRAFTGAH